MKKVEQVNPHWTQKSSITEGNGELVSSSCSTMLHISLSAELLYSFIPLYKTEWDVAGWPFISCVRDDTILLCVPRHRTWERTWAHLKAVSDQSTRPWFMLSSKNFTSDLKDYSDGNFRSIGIIIAKKVSFRFSCFVSLLQHLTKTKTEFTWLGNRKKAFGWKKMGINSHSQLFIFLLHLKRTEVVSVSLD